MGNLIDRGSQQSFDGMLLLRTQLTQTVSLALHLGLRDVMKFSPQRPQRGAEIKRAQRLLKLHYFGIHDQLGALGLALPFANVGRHHGYKIVYVEDKEIGQLAYRWINVARHTYVDKKRGAVAPLFQHLASDVLRDYIVWRCGRANNDIRPGKVIRKASVIDGFAAKFVRQF